MTLRIQKVVDLQVDMLNEILLESKSNGFNAISRVITDWNSGSNRFDRPGEALFLAQQADRCIGTCGLNLDPYAQSAPIGRIRRLYVLSHYRRQGVGRSLVKQVISEACLSFEWLHVRTNSLSGNLLYRSLGFVPDLTSETVTHKLRLNVSSIDDKEITSL